MISTETILLERTHGFEFMAFVGEPTLPLSIFALALFSVKMSGNDWKRMRLPETQRALEEERDMLGDKEAVGRQLLQVIDGRSVAWIKNKYPYNGLFQLGHQFLQECLYKPAGDLSLEEMILETQKRYRNKSVFIFKNGDQRKSVQIDHAHAVVEV